MSYKHRRLSTFKRAIYSIRVFPFVLFFPHEHDHTLCSLPDVLTFSWPLESKFFAQWCTLVHVFHANGTAASLWGYLQNSDVLLHVLSRFMRKQIHFHSQGSKLHHELENDYPNSFYCCMGGRDVTSKRI